MSCVEGCNPSRGHMKQYRCYLLDSEGKIFDRKYIETHDQAAALSEAGKILSENSQAEAAELWDGAFLVERLRKLDR